MTNCQYAFARIYNGQSVIVSVNNADNDAWMNLQTGCDGEYVGALSGERVNVCGGTLSVNVKANSGEIWIPAAKAAAVEPVVFETVKEVVVNVVEEKRPEEPVVTVPGNKSYEEMTVEELQAAILARMAQNGPVTDEMRRTVDENVYHNSLVNWIRSFN